MSICRAYSLISLWEIMKPFHASSFAAISRTLETVLISLPDTSDLIPEKHKDIAKRTLVPLADDCEALGLTASLMSARKMLDEYAKDNCQMGKIRALAIELQERLIDEMQGRQFFSLSPAEAGHYTWHWKGWEEVFSRFPNAMTDVEEARKCLAFGRYTAVVFHLMRVTEAAVLEFQCFLDPPLDPKAHFGSVLKKLDQLSLKTEFKNLPNHLKPYADFLKDVLPQLHAVKASWRNKVSHIDDRIIIADVFTEEMALGIYSATLLLMKQLASGLPPKPTADETGSHES
jgi:hypothetical protein